MLDQTRHVSPQSVAMQLSVLISRHALGFTSQDFHPAHLFDHGAVSATSNGDVTSHPLPARPIDAWPHTTAAQVFLANGLVLMVPSHLLS